MEIATIRPNGCVLGRVKPTELGKLSIGMIIVMTMAGAIAEAQYLRRTCDFNEHPKDRDLIRTLVRTSPLDRWEDCIRTPQFGQALIDAHSFVRNQWSSIYRVAKLLLDRTTVRHSDIVRAM